MSRPMDLGGFSVSLPVADLAAARAFYELLGFGVVGGDAEENWLILRNGEATIGLFHGMFDAPILTFNPGLLQDGSRPSSFTDVREFQAALLAGGVELVEPTDPDGTGPAHIVFTDPDGHRIMIDQFFDRPEVPPTD